MYNYSYKRIRVCFAVILIILSISMLTCSAAAADRYQWYCVHARNHLRPTLDSTLSWITQAEYGAYYLDPGKTDESTEDHRVLYLTFDVGYENGNVAKVLDTLKEKNVPGAFFILAHVLNEEEALVNRMFDEGHLVCNHTMHHPDMSKITEQSRFSSELMGLEELCLQKTGHPLAKFYRPPEGKFTRDQLLWAKELGYRTAFWSFAYADWDNQRQPDPHAAIEKIMSNLHNGAIILLHPTSATNADILGEVIDRCREQGYRFESLQALTEQEI